MGNPRTPRRLRTFSSCGTERRPSWAPVTPGGSRDIRGPALDPPRGVGGDRRDEDGMTRLSFADEARAARDLVANYMEEAGLEAREDAAGT